MIFNIEEDSRFILKYYYVTVVDRIILKVRILKLNIVYL